MASTAGTVGRVVPVSRGARLIESLRVQGFRVPFSADALAPVHGVQVRLPLGALRDERLAGVTACRLGGFVAAGVPVTVAPLELGPAEKTEQHWREFCTRLRDALGVSASCQKTVVLAIASHLLPLDACCEIVAETLGEALIYVFLDSLQMTPHCDARVQDRSVSNWRYLWQRRDHRCGPRPYYGGFVRSSCALLAEEVAPDVLPDLGLCAPVDSAWLPMTISLASFIDRNGCVDESKLEHSFSTAIETADELHAHVCWATPGQRRDAAENRRIAIQITGVGDVVAMSGADPTELDCLEWMLGIIRRVRAVVDETSAQLASRLGGVPALTGSCAVGEWLDGPDADAWRRHFEIARQRSAVRHRNLLTMSPYAVLPSAGRSHRGFADLLPVLREADAWCFRESHAFSGWTAPDFCHFHRRARAVIQRRGPGSFVADRV